MGVNYNLSEVRIEGLETLDYLDNLCNRERFTEQGDAITFESEVNSGFSLTAASHVKELASSALQVMRQPKLFKNLCIGNFMLQLIQEQMLNKFTLSNDSGRWIEFILVVLI